MSLNHQAPMKIEEKIDAALKLVSETQPPAAMASRIHRNLETAVAASGETRQGWLIWVSATAVAMVAILFVVFLQAHWVGEKRVPVIETARIATMDSVSPDRTVILPAASHERKGSAANVHRNIRRRDHVQYRHAANLFNYPMTEQEKLLLRFVQTAKPADLEILNPEYQVKVAAQQEAEFAAYVRSGQSSSIQGIAAPNEFTEE